MNSNRLVLIARNQHKFNVDLFQPIKNYDRIRYTNYAINAKYLICGASSGGLYLFSRRKNELKFLFIIPSKHGEITSIVFSKNNLDLLAFGTNKGTFKLILLKLSSLDEQQWQEIYLAKRFTEHAINLIIFQDDDINEFRLFLADQGYNVYMISKMKTFASIFKSEPPVRLLSFDAPVHQLEANKQYLLVAADDKSSIFNMEKISLNKIGEKARPCGVFGSCFYSMTANDLVNSEINVVFTARPSLRLWQANQEGSVTYTHQFKDYLKKSDANLIYFFGNEFDNEVVRMNFVRSRTKPQLANTNFNQIYKLHIKRLTYLVTFTNVPNAMLFIINPLNAKIVFWTNQLINPITKIMISEDELIICHRNESKNGEDRSNFDRSKLFTLIKVYDLEDFVNNEEHVLNLSNLNLILFLKENKYLIDSMKECPRLAKHIETEWSKLDSTLKSLFDDLIDTIERRNDKPKIDHTANDAKTLFAGTELIANSESDSASHTSALSEDWSAEHLRNEESNGMKKKTIDELTSKHRWINSAEPIDEKKVLSKKMSNLIQSLDREELDRFRCKCGKPSPRAHLLLNSKQREMQLILNKLLNDDNLNETLNLCFDYGIWSMYLELLILKNRFIDYIEISLILMDIKLLSSNELFMQTFRTDSKLSRDLFGLFVRQKKFNQLNDSNNGTRAICLNCEMKLQFDYIKWQDMIDFLFKNLELDDLIDLFMIHHDQLPRTVLSSKLCIHLLRTGMIKKYESSLTSNKLIRLNQHLAIQNSKQLKPQVPNTKHMNWSMLLDLNERDCDICKKPLRDCRDPLLVFRCNHVYHKECDVKISRKKTCFVCSNFQ